MIWNGIDIGQILTGIVLLCLPPLFLFLAKAAKATEGKAEAEGQLLLSKFTAQQQETILNVVHIGVTMAEQIIKRQDVQDYGNAKLESAFAFIEGHLQELGISVSEAAIKGMIESAVQQVFNDPPKLELQPVVVNNSPAQAQA